MRGGSDRLPLSCFRLRDQRFTVRAFSGRPSTGRASCSCGTSPLIREASPATDIDSSNSITMSHPSTVCTDVGAVLCFVSGTASRAFLRCVCGVYLLYLEAKPLCFIGNEHRELIEAPTIFHAVVFAGFCPTTFACRALAYTLQGFYLDRSYALLMSVVDDLPGKLMVDIFHPSGLFALAFSDGAYLFGLLQLLASAVEASSHMSLIAPIAKETRAVAPDMGNGRNFDAQINTHDGLPI